MMEPAYTIDRKVAAGGVAGVIAAFLMMLARKFGYPIDVEFQPFIVAAVGSAIAYVVPPSKQDILKRLNDDIVKQAIEDPKIPVTPNVVKK